MRRTLLLSLLVVGAALALVAGSYSAFAGGGPVADAVSAVVGADDPDVPPLDVPPDDVPPLDVPPGDGGAGVVQENGPGTGHEECFAATEHARSVLSGLLDGTFFENLDLPDQASAGLSDQGKEGVASALEAIENCGMGTDAVGLDGEDADCPEAQEPEQDTEGEEEGAHPGLPDGVPQGPPADAGPFDSQ